jgi:CubicO group peptidase (beta-lactamase class C family)
MAEEIVAMMHVRNLDFICCLLALDLFPLVWLKVDRASAAGGADAHVTVHPLAVQAWTSADVAPLRSGHLRTRHTMLPWTSCRERKQPGTGEQPAVFAASVTLSRVLRPKETYMLMIRWGLFFLALFCLHTAVGQTQTAAADWPGASAVEGGLDEARLRTLETAIRSDQFKKIGSVLVARHGKLVYESYFEGDANSLRDTRSATKSITGALVGIAIAENKLSGVDARVLSLLPERARKLQNPDPRKAAITVEDFLTMSSPLECDDWNDASRGNEERMYLVEDWAQFILDLPIRGRMHVGEAVEPPPHGRYFSYCTGGVFTLSEVLAKATGMRADRYAQKKLFSPLGITNVQWVYSPLNIPQTGGGLRMTSRDLLKIAQLYLNGGQWHGSRIVSESWVKTSTQPHARIDDDTEYGFLWWLKSFKSGEKRYPAFYMMGNGGSKVVAIPSLDMVIVITSTNYNTRGMHEQTEKILTDYILTAVKEP